MIASVLRLTRADIKLLKITDDYSLHRIVYDLYEDIRTEEEKASSVPSGILYVDKGGDFHCREILMLSNRPPKIPEHGEVQSKRVPDAFLQHENYGFQVIINPTKRDKKAGKIIAICGGEAIAQWFLSKSQEAWGFTVTQDTLQVQRAGVRTFKKSEHNVVHGHALLRGELVVTDREKFIRSFKQGIGRGRAFGFGLLQLIPLSTSV